MAIDQWLLEQCHQDNHSPTLRFYQWTPAAISLGRNQSTWPQHWQDLIWQGSPIDLVRRPTGGRTVLHAGDLTYAIALPYSHRNRRQAYAELCQFLIQGWQYLGVRLHFGEPRRNYTHKANCFATATDADLVLDNGYKFIGSAQAWQGQTVLQHGSMRLVPNPDLAQRVFGPELPPQGNTELAKLSTPDIIDAMIEAAKTCFRATFTCQPLSPTELEAIRQLELSSINQG
ncbi:lipoate--protein ligase family protein [Acaryochloris sp. IP29b_bin.137]|uniref:lipoate--protein ligase family protein n=1 Tax=Acaryochloris sp. IP29b_bin.137 TaxID=2969217 RepID=UPI002613B448|nr:lipoate--protein ligase family protein [Acaryochloris sp. IP29b_bin.137]